MSVDRRAFEQRAYAETVLDVSWPGIEVRARSVMDITVTGAGVDVAIESWVDHDGTEISHRMWSERIPPPYYLDAAAPSGAQVQDADLEELLLVLVAQEDVPRQEAGRLQALELVRGGVLAAVELTGRTVCHGSRVAPAVARSAATRGGLGSMV